MRNHLAALTWIMALCPACDPGRRERSPPDGSDSDRASAYGNPEDTTDPLNPSNKGRNPRVVDAQGNVLWFPLKPGGAQLYYGNGQPMRTPQGAPVRATGSVRLNYGMRLGRGGRTYFLAWQTNPDAPADSGMRNATGWVAADEMTAEGAAAKAAIPRRLGNVARPLARDAGGKPRTFVVNGMNEQAKAAVALELAYIGVANHHRDKAINFLNLHDGRAGVQLLVNLPNVRGGGIAADCFPNGTPFTAAADPKGGWITQSIRVYDKHGAGRALTFLYGKAGETWGWVVRDWLD
jgi:hypothetical protein